MKTDSQPAVTIPYGNPMCHQVQLPHRALPLLVVISDPRGKWWTRTSSGSLSYGAGLANSGRRSVWLIFPVNGEEVFSFSGLARCNLHCTELSKTGSCMAENQIEHVPPYLRTNPHRRSKTRGNARSIPRKPPAVGLEPTTTRLRALRSTN